MKKMTLQDLQKRRESVPGEILIACDGKVYDVSGSSRWKGGIHMKRHQAGEDLNRAIDAAPHGKEVLQKFPVIAELDTGTPAANGPGRLIGFVLDMHPHPASVHFPIALLVTAAFLTIAGWLLTNDLFIRTGYINLVLGTIATPFTISAGFLSFHYNYNGKWTRTFRLKTVLGIAFFLIALAAVILHWLFPGDMSMPGPVQFVYLVLVLCLPPIVGATGYLGGTITFPRQSQR